MADTFFGFNSSLNNGDNLLPPDDEDDCLENEEEYDALNDETFGASTLEDWEEQHEQFAEIAEICKHSEQIEQTLSHLDLDSTNDIVHKTSSNDSLSVSSTSNILPLSNSVWSYIPENRNGDNIHSSILSSLQEASKSFIESHTDASKSNITNSLNTSLRLPMGSSNPKNICTVEELEKNLIKTSCSKPVAPPQMQHQQPPHPQILPRPPLPSFHPLLSLQHQNTRLPPPGMPPMGMPPPGMGHVPPHQMNPHHPLLPLMKLMPPFMHGNGPPPPRPPGFMYPPGNNQMPVNHPFNFPPPPRHMNNMVHNNTNNHMNRNNYQPLQQRVRHDSGNYRHKDQQSNSGEVVKDEYAGLMTTREKQWLLNIQLLQLNTGTPYFDDYYYTVFKERKTKSNKENFLNERNHRFPNNRQQRNNERQENSNTLTPRIYTPLQFENSLGKLQCGSVTAPRKIIDMDIVTPEKDSDAHATSRDTRKTKQLLLELEALYTLLLKAEDLKNPLAISNMEKLRELKQKQRFRELELASTPEMKQEVLNLFMQESEPIVENQYDYIMKIISGLLQEDKFSSFLNIRKGKMLLLRLLPNLTFDSYGNQLVDIWSRVLLSLPIVGRRDTSGDNILPKLYPFFKRYIQSSSMVDVLEIVTGLVEVVRQENSRSTPLSHQGKAPLYFVILNKFGVSALVTLLIRTEYLISSETTSDKQQNDWSNFLVSWAELTGVVNKVATPLELIPQLIFNKHCNRFANLTLEKKSLLEKHFVDSN